jgi:hypothetical protein
MAGDKNSSLDTLVQLAYKENQTVSNPSLPRSFYTAKEYKKKAVRIHNTYKLIWGLIDLESPLEKQYWQSYHCCRELIQEGCYLRAHYCNKRWCFECNAIRCAKMINGYMPVFDKFKGVQFVTLTRPNVKEEQLQVEVNDLIRTFQLMISYLKRYKDLNIKGLRKIEITYNILEDTYHPHFHVLVNSKEAAYKLVKEWLYRNPEASQDAQHIEPANKGSYTELFKYAAKIIKDLDESSIHLHALDKIFQVLNKKRIYQPFGIRRAVTEDIEEIYSQAVGSLEPDIYKIWRFDNTLQDWFTLSGQSLIETILNFNSS